MKLKQKFIFKSTICFTLIIFVLETFLFSPQASAELSCWNDGSLTIATGGSDVLTGTQKGNPNPQGTEKVIDPVNLATGDFFYEQLDLSIPSRGMALEFKRFYNNQDDYDGPFGVGWSHAYNIFLLESSDGESDFVIRRNPNGNKDKFLKNPDSSYTAPAGIFDTLVKNAGGYTITTKHGIVYQFNLAGYLISITDRNGNAVGLTYDAVSGVLNRITDTVGRQIIFEYTSTKKIFKISDFSGRTWKYEYLNGDLKSVTTPATLDFPFGAITNYSYLNHNLVSITDARANKYIDITYDNNDRVDEMALASNRYDFEYSQNLTTLIDPKGNQIDYLLNDDGTIATMKEFITGIGVYQTLYEYNADKLVAKVTYPKMNWVAYAYDKGNLLEERQSFGLPELDIVTTFTYEPQFNFIKTITDPRGYTTTYFYDYEEASLGDLNGDGFINQNKGNLVKVSYPEVNGQVPEARFTYNSYGQPENIIDPNGNIKRFEYYPLAGYPKKIIDGYGVLNIANEMSYDAVGNLWTIKDPKQNITTFEYDSHNNLIKETSPAPFSHIISYKYDANDNLIQIDRQTDDPANPWQSVYYTYNILDRLETIKDDTGNTTYFEYDPSGNRSLIMDAELKPSLYEYNERNLLWKITDAENNTTEYTYDANGNLQIIKDAKLNATIYDYDYFDRLILISYPDYSTEYYTYDAASNIKTKRDPREQVITYDYDALNRLDLETYPDVSTVDYIYDNGSRLTDVIDSRGAIHYDYDAVDRIKSVVYPGNKSVSYEYDNNSNRYKLTYPDSTYVTCDYDELNRLTYIKDQSGQIITHYTYDALHRKKQLDLANGTQIVYDYDSINRIIQTANRLAGQPNFSQYDYPLYDNVGNCKTMTTSGGTYNYAYDNIYQLKTVNYPAGFAFDNTVFDYDGAGNRLSATDSSVTFYTPNNLNQYTQVGAANYDNDPNGNLVSDGVFTFGYDYENRLVSADKAGVSFSYKYDPFGRRVQKRDNIAGVITNYIYDSDQIIAEYNGSDALIGKYVYGADIDEPVKMERGVNNYYYHFDGLGSITDITDSSGSNIESYRYDVFGKPDSVSGIANRFMFTGREYDEETGLYYYRARHYDPKTGRFLQRDPIGYIAGINLYTYCENNPANLTDPHGYWALWDDLAVSAAGAVYGAAKTYSGDVISNVREGKRGLGALKATSPLRTYIAQAAGGAAQAEASRYGGPTVGAIAGAVVADLVESKLKKEKINKSKIIENAFVAAASSYIGNKVLPRGPGRPAKIFKTLVTGKVALRGYARQAGEKMMEDAYWEGRSSAKNQAKKK